jgi:hypothetical protein
MLPRQAMSKRPVFIRRPEQAENAMKNAASRQSRTGLPPRSGAGIGAGKLRRQEYELEANRRYADRLHANRITLRTPRDERRRAEQENAKQEAEEHDSTWQQQLRSRQY